MIGRGCELSDDAVPRTNQTCELAFCGLNRITVHHQGSLDPPMPETEQNVQVARCSSHFIVDLHSKILGGLGNVNS